ESDYVVCARGGGNFSYRLYEALSLGRIPIFIDTDCVLPFETEIDWRSLCVWVDERELDEIGDRLAAFHAALDGDGLEERQRECRRVFETYLSVEGFFRHLARRAPA
ncbi:MAG TPA: exostosin family protein, partial [Gaiellaceae bacterium]|nr:exostosin family protein [Gaiellaceae bacterium]